MKALVNALTLALVREDMGWEAAFKFAEQFVADNAELFAPKEVRVSGPVALTEGVRPVAPEQGDRAIVHHVPVVGPDGLTDRQRAAVGTVGLCPNCQQPKNAHAPGCAVASGEDPKARTANRLPPLV